MAEREKVFCKDCRHYRAYHGFSGTDQCAVRVRVINKQYTDPVDGPTTYRREVRDCREFNANMDCAEFDPLPASPQLKPGDVITIGDDGTRIVPDDEIQIIHVPGVEVKP